MIWVGRLGPDAIAAVGVSGMIVMFVMTAMMGVCHWLQGRLLRGS
jgi:Na+-driven multidrug efflux pump